MMVQQCPFGTFPYIILPGDNYYVLANRYNTTVEAIAAANPGINPNNLQVGQAICVPALKPLAPCPNGSKIYLVQAGDSLYSIAQKFNVPFDVLFSANSGLDPANLQIGQAVCIPSLPACPVNSVPYAIKPGDTYYTLSEFTGVPINDLIIANPGIDPNNLQVGQVICLPYRPIPTPYQSTNIYDDPGESILTQGPPATPPPSFTPSFPQEPGTFRVDPGALAPCTFRFSYIWLVNGQSFWAYLIYVGRTSASGWRYRRGRWVYFGVDLREIQYFICY